MVSTPSVSRYEVVVHRRPAPELATVADVPTLAWADLEGGLDGLAAALDDRPALRVTGVPNGRIGTDRLPDAPVGIDPEDVIAMGERLRRAVVVTLSADGNPGDLDVVFTTPGTGPLAGVYRDAPRTGPLTNTPSAGSRRGLLIEDLRSGLAGRLPAFMVPASVVVVDALPLTPNGKVDRRALPAPDVVVGGGRVAGSPEERGVCDVLAAVLGVARVGVDDDFFDLGGHSLLAMRVVGRLRSLFGVELPLQAVFDKRTAGGLVESLREVGGRMRPPVVPRARPEVLPVSFAQRRLWFLHRLEGASATYNIPLALEVTGTLDIAALEAAVDDVVRRHEPLRTVIGERDGVPYQCIRTVRIGVFVREVADEDLHGMLAAAVRHRFDLETDPPIRVTVFRTAPDACVVLLLVHHVAGDGWSLRPLLRDLTTAYAARLDGRSPGWAPLPVSYADYTLWQRDLLGDLGDPQSLAAQQLAYWRENLAGLPEQITLPVDRPRPAV